MKLSLKDLLSNSQFAAETVCGPVLFADGKELTKDQRADMLNRVRAGEHIEIEVEAVTFIQRDTPNRNFIRLKEGVASLKKIAKSGKGTPFLRDHDQQSVLSRGGTIIESTYEKTSEGGQFRQRIKLVKPWAVEGVLDGTIDRFSVGLYPHGKVTYRHNGKEVEDWPEYYPGDVLEDGTQVEFVTDADLVESSAVNVPAVTGTSIEGIRAAMAADQPQREHPKKEKSMKRIMTTLGLSEAASEEVAADAIVELQTSNKRQATELAAVKVQLSEAQQFVEKAKQAEAERAAVRLEADIADLYKEGKLMHGRDAAGHAVPAPMEIELRKCYAAGGRELFDSVASTLPAMLSSEVQSDAPAPPRLATDGYDAGRVTRLRSSGMSPERHAELAQRAQRNGRS